MKKFLPILIAAVIMLSSCSYVSPSNNTDVQNLAKTFIDKLYTVDATSLNENKTFNENNAEQIYGKFKDYMTDEGFSELVNNRTGYQNIVDAEKTNSTKSVSKISFGKGEGGKDAYQMYYNASVVSTCEDTNKKTSGVSSGIINFMSQGGKWKVKSIKITSKM